MSLLIAPVPAPVGWQRGSVRCGLLVATLVGTAGPALAGQVGAVVGGDERTQSQPARNGAAEGSVLGNALSGQAVLPGNNMDQILELRRGERDSAARPGNDLPTAGKRTPMVPSQVSPAQRNAVVAANPGGPDGLPRGPQAPQVPAVLSLEGGPGGTAFADPQRANRAWSGTDTGRSTQADVGPYRRHPGVGTTGDGVVLMPWASQLAQYLRQYRVWLLGALVLGLVAVVGVRWFIRRFARRV